MPSPKIKDVQVITCQPAGVRLIVVKVLTDQDGLYGYGCGTFTQRADLVVPAVEKYLKPFLVGKPADRIDDIWQAMYNSSYWRNGPVLNNAISGVDQALWDIKGRQADMPVYQLLGGKVREAADCYGHASGGDIPEVIDQAQKYMRAGIPARPRAGRRPGHGGLRFGPRRREGRSAAFGPGIRAGRLHPPRAEAVRGVPQAACPKRSNCCHDVHERVTPTQAVQFARTSRSSSCSSSKIRSRPKTSSGSG